MATKKIAGVDTGTVVNIALLAGAGYGIYYLVNKLGSALSTGGNSAAAVKNVNTTNATPGNPFDPNFYNKQTKNITILTTDAASQFAQQIYNALDTFFFNDYNTIYGIFQQLKTQGQVSFLANEFQNMYGKSLLSWLEYANGNEPDPGQNDNILLGAALGGGLTNDQMSTIINYVNALPNT